MQDFIVDVSILMLCNHHQDQYFTVIRMRINSLRSSNRCILVRDNLEEINVVAGMVGDIGPEIDHHINSFIYSFMVQEDVILVEVKVEDLEVMEEETIAMQ